MDTMTIWYWVSSLGLAALLFRPVKKFILVQRLKRTAAKLKRQLTEDEIKDLEKRTSPWTVFIVIIFSLLFNSVIMGKYYK
jgi:hypothetical protein